MSLRRSYIISKSQNKRNPRFPMSEKTNIFLLCIFLYTTVLLSTTANAEGLELINKLPNSVSVHCKSGDDDVGLRTVPPGDAYAFEFTGWFNITLYYCRLNWGRKTLIGDVYHRPIFELGTAKCQNLDIYCQWKITETGLHENGFGMYKGMNYYWEDR